MFFTCNMRTFHRHLRRDLCFMNTRIYTKKLGLQRKISSAGTSRKRVEKDTEDSKQPQGNSELGPCNLKMKRTVFCHSFISLLIQKHSLTLPLNFADSHLYGTTANSMPELIMSY